MQLTFGKYKNMNLKDVEPNYLKWIASELEKQSWYNSELYDEQVEEAKSIVAEMRKTPNDNVIINFGKY